MSAPSPLFPLTCCVILAGCPLASRASEAVAPQAPPSVEVPDQAQPTPEASAAAERVRLLESENASLRAQVDTLTQRLERLESQQRASVPVEVERAATPPAPPTPPAHPAVAAGEPGSASAPGGLPQPRPLIERVPVEVVTRPVVTPVPITTPGSTTPSTGPSASPSAESPSGSNGSSQPAEPAERADLQDPVSEPTPAAPSAGTPVAERVTVGPIQIDPERVRGDVFLSAVARPDQPEISVFLHGRNTEAGLGGRRFREQTQDRQMKWRIDGQTVILPVANYEWSEATSRIAGKKRQGRGDELIELRVPRELLERAGHASVWEILISRSTLTMGTEARTLVREALRDR